MRPGGLIREQHQAEQFFLMRRGNRLPQSKKRFHSTFVAWRRGRMEEEPTKRLSNMTQKTSGEPRSDVQALPFRSRRTTRRSRCNRHHKSAGNNHLWDRSTGKPVAPAIVWQSRVSAPICERLKDDGLETEVRRRTGLLIDPYFSATKIMHLFEKYSGLRDRCERGEVLFGTVDSFLIWRLTGGRVHATDVTNAGGTLLLISLPASGLMN